MKQELHVFFDYICPYCLTAHQYLKELIPQLSETTIIWHPCESHPRPEPFHPHSDLSIQGYFYAAEHGVDPFTYHDRMYQAVHKDHINIEEIDVLTGYVRDLVDADGFKSALLQGRYQKKRKESNVLAFEQSGVWAVPAYRMGEDKLDAVEGVGVSKDQLSDFIKNDWEVLR